MALYKRGSVWWYRFSVDGKVRKGSCRTRDEKLALELHDRLKAEAWRGRFLKDTVRRTWVETLSRWLGDHEHKRTYAGDVTYGDWWTDKLASQGVKYLDQITPDVIRQIRDDEIARPRKRNGKPLKPSTVNRKIAVLRAVMNTAAREYLWIPTAPLFRCLPEKNHVVRFLTAPEISRLLAALPEPYKSMAQLSVATGLRKGNVMGLTWEQVDFGRRLMTFPDSSMKNGLPLTIPINETALQALRPWVGKSDQWVFLRSDGERVRGVPSKLWKKALVKAGIENFRWHDLRHTWASLMRQSGEDLSKIQELGAWQDPRMVKRYAHLSVDHLAASASVMDRVLNPSGTSGPVGMVQNWNSR